MSFPFAGLITDRPYPATGLTSRRWREIAFGWMWFEQLVLTQSGVRIWPLFEPPTNGLGDPFPHVVLWRETYYLEDGHHRVVRHALTGRKGMVMRIYASRPGLSTDRTHYEPPGPSGGRTTSSRQQLRRP